MINSLLQQTTIPILEQVSAFGQRRHQVLAGNIANIDTVDYRTRDLPVRDFEKALQNAITARRQNLQPMPMQPGSLSWFPGQMSPSALSWKQPSLQANEIPPTHYQASLQPQPIENYFPEHLQQAEDSESRNVTFHDGGNRSIELESMEMVKNASMQSFAIEVMRNQLNQLETVISERVI